MDNPMTNREHNKFHEEFEKRINAEDIRQNRRIDLLEENVRQINELKVTVEKMAVNMGNMLAELEKQGERLEALENRDGEMWRKITGHVITAVISIVLGFIFAKIGM